MGLVVLIVVAVLFFAVYGWTDSFILGLLGAFTPAILIWMFLGLLKSSDKKAAVKEETVKQENIKKADIILKNEKYELQQILDSVPEKHNVVTIIDTTLSLYLGKFNVWKQDNKLYFVAYVDDELKSDMGSGKVENENQISYSFNLERVSLFERENTEQVVSSISSNGSHYSVWTGTQKVGRTYTTHHTVGGKRTILFIENNPQDIKIMFEYDDYSVLNRLINN